jgi:hypothetical protein
MSSGKDWRIPIIRHKTSLILNLSLTGLSGWPTHESQEKLQNGRLGLNKTSLGQKNDKMMRLRKHIIDISL